jgi:hypothetical protein
LASYTMGPGYLNAQQTTIFPNFPVNQKNFFRFPLLTNVPTSKTETGGGQIGIFVDGVAMFNSWDAFYWNGTEDASGAGTGYWNRDAYVNEGVSFDPGYAHQQNTGVYHYHADPIGLRYLMGDHVNFSNGVYSESTTAPTQHSPILAWTADGFPLYGPYGYSNATNPASGIRRMVSGYVIRNGQYGTSNLTANGRSTIPQWAVRLFNVSSNQTGPAVSTSYPLGRYMEDNDYLGDHGYTQGIDFDLDEYNGRWCVTPDFPKGTYAYFVAISSSGMPVYPYNIGRGYYGSPTGGSVSSFSEAVMTNFLGETNLVQTLNTPAVGNGMVTLSWSALEGGSYQVQSTTNFGTWTVLASGLSPNKILGGYTNTTSLNQNFYRVARTAVASFDSASLASGVQAPGGSVTRGTTVTVTITLPTNPPDPPTTDTVTSVILAGSISGSNISYPAQGTVVATFVIPSNASTGAQNIVVTFQNGPPPYTMTGALTIN